VSELLVLKKKDKQVSGNGFIPLTRPTLPDLNEVMDMVQASYRSGIVTVGRLVDVFEREIQTFTGASHAVSVASCTSGLMLSYAALEAPEGSEVVVPSFTFAATVQAVIWNRLVPVFVDCLPGTLTMDPDEVRKAIGPKTVAICPVNVFGLAPDVDELEAISARDGIPLVFDSAQGLGSFYRDRPAGGFGLCEVFSLSPTKVITAIEGGVVTTNDKDFADRIRSMRDYGKGPDGQDMIFNGLSCRMSEFHAAVGILNLRNAASLISSRVRITCRYREKIAQFPGCSLQSWPADRSSTVNYCTIMIGDEAAVSRDDVYDLLTTRGIQTKRYFFPPVHLQTAIRSSPNRTVGVLPQTLFASSSSLALPLYSHIESNAQGRVLDALAGVFKARTCKGVPDGRRDGGLL
jgi:dTDP-4-amino-4,6-dideoxygalactose transaminase